MEVITKRKEEMLKRIKEYLKTQLFLDIVTTIALTLMLAGVVFLILLQL